MSEHSAAVAKSTIFATITKAIMEEEDGISNIINASIQIITLVSFNVILLAEAACMAIALSCAVP